MLPKTTNLLKARCTSRAHGLEFVVLWVRDSELRLATDYSWHQVLTGPHLTSLMGTAPASAERPGAPRKVVKSLRRKLCVASRLRWWTQGGCRRAVTVPGARRDRPVARHECRAQRRGVHLGRLFLASASVRYLKRKVRAQLTTAGLLHACTSYDTAVAASEGAGKPGTWAGRTSVPPAGIMNPSAKALHTHASQKAAGTGSQQSSRCSEHAPAADGVFMIICPGWDDVGLPAGRG
jgi:hypothetical protein